MTDNKDNPFSDYGESDEVAKMLGISRSRLYDYIRAGRLRAKRVGKSYLIHKKDVERFKANPSGRTRTKPPAWRIYQSGAKVLELEILVDVRASQQERLIEKLQTIQDTNQHTFLGTMARYIFQDDGQSGRLQILLIWKDTEIPDEEIRQRDLAAFQAELADMLDWEHAHIQSRRALMHT
jgi:excisionase family DNA binding protein